MSVSLPTFDFNKALVFHPFQDDFGSPGDRILSDKICFPSKDHPGACHICRGVVVKRRPSRKLVGKYDGELRSFRWCEACIEAMANSWQDDGKSLEARYRLDRELVGGVQ